MEKEVASDRSSRIEFLDGLRGFAMLGILVANIPSFGLPAWDPSAWSAPSGAEAGPWLAWLGTRLFVDDKFITLFALLFGSGIVLMRRSCAGSGRSFAPVMIRRLVFLGAAGLAHVVLLWWGDVLGYYALFGLICFAASAWSARALERTGTVLLLVPPVLLVAAFAVTAIVQVLAPEVLAPPPVPDAAPLPALGDGWEGFWAGFFSHDPRFETTVYREGSFAQVAVLRSATWLYTLYFGIGYYGWRVAGLFLMGMAWAKDGWWLAPAANRDSFARLVTVGVWTGLPATVLSCALAAWNAGAPVAVAAELCQYAGSLGLAAAYAGAFGLAYARATRPPGLARLEAVGRTAFSNYLAQSLLCTLFFYSYGAGFFGMLDRLQLWGVVAAVWALELVASPAWLRRFRLGPLEWVWRAATYGGRPPVALPGVGHDSDAGVPGRPAPPRADPDRP